LDIVDDNKILRALLISVRTPEVTDLQADESLAELERLVTTLGFKVVARDSQRRPSTGASTVLGEGKLKELAVLTGRVDDDEKKSDEAAPRPRSRTEASAESKRQADVVVFDCDLTPSQMRNLEKSFGVEVMDRTGVIIEIFSRHAKTRAARLQVEIARLNYMAPRVRETSGGTGERQAGRGAGESQLELDRRRIRDRVTELKAELEGVQREADNRRHSRAEQGLVALVGYTNAGKSSTMRALTGSDVLVENKLFATLDTTVRALHPETRPRILVSDTVGFIKKLPHDLVASFKSTLDEALNASLLLYVVDAADPTFRAQLEVTRGVLAEVGATQAPSIIVLNKADQLDEPTKRRLAMEFPRSIIMTTRKPEDVARLREEIVAFFEQDMVDEELLIPYDIKGIIGEIRSTMRVVKEDFENEGVRLKLRAPQEDLVRLRKKFKL
jgi:GTP-binding protein HflX